MSTADVTARIARLSPDRRRLLETLLAQRAAPGSPAPRVEPRNATERALCDIFREVLGVDVSVHDNYFELGGDSILSVAVLAKARAAGIALTLDQLFRTPTVAALAAACGPRTDAPGSTAAPADRGDVHPLTPLQRGLLFHTIDAPQAAPYVSQFSCRIAGPLQPDLFRHAWDVVVDRHAALRTAIEYDARGEPRQRVWPAARVPFATYDWSDSTPDEQRTRLESLRDAERREPFELSRPPLMRLAVIRAGASSHWCVWTHHHLLLDGWSHHLVLDEVFRVCAGGDARPPGETSPPPSFGAYVSWLNARDAAAAERFWTAYLADVPRTPVGRTDASESPQAHCTDVRVLGRDAAVVLHRGARAHRVAPATLLYAAWALALPAHADDAHALLGVTTAIRPADLAGSERIVGLCINTVPLVVTFAEGDTVAALVRRLHDRQGPWLEQAHAPLPQIARWSRLDARSLLASLLVVENVPRLFVRPPHEAGLALDDVRFTVHESCPIVAVCTPEPDLTLELKYDPARYTREQVSRISQAFETAIAALAAQPELPVSTLKRTLAMRRDADEMSDVRGRRERDLSRLAAMRARRDAAAVRTAAPPDDESLVAIAPLLESGPMPAVIRPRGAPLDVAGWVRGNAHLVDRLRLEHGAVLLRGFSGGGQSTARDVLTATGGSLMPYVERSTPRREVDPFVYTSTEYPADQAIPFHNENAYAHRWPLYVAFHCVTAPSRGGETPIADCREALRLLNAEIVERFRRLGVLYVHNYREDLGLNWQTVFGTTSRSDVEAYCRNAGYQVDWRPDGTLRTRRVGPAVVRHPRTGDEVWFNHAAFFHVSSLDARTRNALLQQYAGEELPHHTYYGDGQPIEPEVLSAIREAYASARVTFAWEPGDLLLVDNVRVAHARAPYTGPRRILVAFAEGDSAGGALPR